MSQPLRWAEEHQPEPVVDEKAHKSQRYRAQARVGRMGTGKATGTKISEYRFVVGPSLEEVLARRENFIEEYLATRKRKRGAGDSSSSATEASTTSSSRPSRGAAPKCLAEPKLAVRNATSTHAGPGRGHKYEPARSVREQLIEGINLPPADALDQSWFRRYQIMHQWKSERIVQLEQQVETLLLENEQHLMTIKALRSKVTEIERMQNEMAMDLISYVESTPVLKEAAHAKRLEENPEWALILGLGYNNTQRRNLIYQHLKKLLEELRRVTQGDVMKAKQLADLLYLRVHAGELKKQENVQQITQHRQDVAEGIVESIRSFVHALHNAGGKGRYPDKIRKAQQVVATAVSKAVVLSKTKITVAEVADALGLERHMIAKCEARFNALTDGEWEQLFDDRQAERSDQIPEAWRDFALQFWTDPFLADEHGQAYNFVRRSERAADEIRDPDNRKSSERYRITWLEEKIGVIYDAMVRAAKRTFGESVFHMSMPFFLELRPFYVKDAKRETCMCVYHLRWREFSEGLLNYRRALKQQKVSNCSCSIPVNEKAFRKQLICPRHRGTDEQKLDNLDCIQQRCDACKDLRKLNEGEGSLCAEEMRDPGGEGEALSIKYEAYEKVDYTTKDGTVKSKKDFVSKVVPFSEFKRELSKYWPKFVMHHNDAKWHDDDFIAMKAKLPKGVVALVIDYAENYSHEPKFEHQSKYFSQVQTTIIPVVLMVRVEDLTNISSEERDALIATLDEHGEPHVISETHYVISSDMQHDNCMVQKLLDDFIIPYVKENVPSVRAVHVRSDGCKAQFKCAANFHWVSRQTAEGHRVRIFWSFFASCHGKCYCDPEGGTLKNGARRHELTITNREDQLKDSEALYIWARDRSGLATPKVPLKQKKGKGIYRRFFYWVPSKGTGAVNRSRQPKYKAEGTSKLHEFVDVGLVGTVSARRAACHQCDQCWSDDVGERRSCKNISYTGAPHELRIVLEAIPTAGAARIDRATLHRAALARAPLAALHTIVCLETHKDEQTYPWVIGKVTRVAYTADQSSLPPPDDQTDAIQFEKVRVNDLALDVALFEPLQPGSTVYKLAGMRMPVPARSVRVIDVELEETRGSARLTAGEASKRWSIVDSSLQAIRAEMPTSTDDWEVERVVEYRCVYGVEQWLVKWKNFAEDRNTWEPIENLLTPQVKAEAAAIREKALVPRNTAGLQKFTLVTLKAVLASHGLDVLGSKGAIIARLLEVLPPL